MKKWLIRHRKADYEKLVKDLGINSIIVKILVNRGIKKVDLIKAFISPKVEDLHNPLEMKDINKAINIIDNKIKEKRKIRIIGDYDVDGVMSSYILYMGLKGCGADVDYEIPDRVEDGYGINISMIDKAYQDNINTIITCDNGIAAIDAVNHAKELGMTIIITDHHEVPFTEDDEGKRIYVKTKADAVINPKQDECNYKFKHLCGAGVAYKLVEALYNSKGIDKNEYYKFIEFVAIATVCDVVDLVGENRIFVQKGLEMINRTKNIGLQELIKQNGIESNKIKVYHLGFIIGPCINASGRLDTAKKGLDMLIDQDKQRAKKLAKELYNLNQDRKLMTEKGTNKAIEKVENTDIKNDKIFVIYIDDIHESLAGIIAGRVKELYNRPTIVFTKTQGQEDIVKGSGRSIETYDMHGELQRCTSLLIKFGGHPMAAGLTIKAKDVDLLRRRLNEQTGLNDEDLKVKLILDTQLEIENINKGLVDELNKLEPFGKGNSKPIFGEKEVKIEGAKILGKNKNVLKLNISKKDNSKTKITGIYFKEIADFEKLIIDKYGKEGLKGLYNNKANNIYLDIAYYPEYNIYNGLKNIQLIIQDFR